MRNSAKGLCYVPFICSALLFCVSTSAQTTRINEIGKLLTSDGASQNIQHAFGNSVDVDGNTAVIAAWLDDDAGPGSGAVYVFTRTAGVWSEQQKLTASDGASLFGFGFGVAVDGDTIAVSTFNDGWNGFRTGSAYVFTRTAGVWSEQQKLTASDGVAGDLFGYSISLDGDTVIVGARDDGFNDSGSAYVFTRTAGVWTEQQKITGSDVGLDDGFGFDVHVDANTAVIGTWKTNSAYVFTRTAGVWIEQQKLERSTASRFSWSVGVSGDTIVVGAPDERSAYVFTLIAGVWIEQQKLTGSDAPPNGFGINVDVDGNTVVIASHLDSENVSKNGAAYVFGRTAGVWTEQVKLLASDGQRSDRIASDHGALAVSGITVLAGTSHHDSIGISESGAAYVFQLWSNDTPTGTDVNVFPEPVDELGDPIAGAPAVTFEFDSVIGSGETTVTIADSGPPPPTGFKLIGLTGGTTYFDLETMAVFDGSVTLCINYSDLTVAGDPANLTFAHNEGGIWVNITSSNDTANKVICGMTSFFSFFAIIEVADPITLLADLVDAVAALNAKKGIINNLDAKLDAADRALTDAIENNDFAAMNVLMNAFINATEAQRGNEISDAEADDLIDRAQEIALVLQGVTL